MLGIKLFWEMDLPGPGLGPFGFQPVSELLTCWQALETINHHEGQRETSVALNKGLSPTELHSRSVSEHRLRDIIRNDLQGVWLVSVDSVLCSSSSEGTVPPHAAGRKHKDS